MNNTTAQKMDFANRLITLMREHGVGVREAASLAGVPPSTINNWRSGSAPRDFTAVKRLAEALGTTLSLLLTGESDAASSSAAPTPSAVFPESELVFDGYAKLRIERLIPRHPTPRPQLGNVIEDVIVDTESKDE
jgi:transcriptional regulator with XRE-family HTH domain